MLSIIIPVYNGEKHIEKCLNSIFSQEYKDIEVICVDDRSEDASLSLVKKYAEKEERLSVIELSENSGACIARKEGAKQAKGRYIWFVDSDDTIEQGSIGFLMNEEEKDRVDILHFGTNILNEKGLDDELIINAERFFGHNPERLAGEDILIKCFLDKAYDFNLWNKLFDAELIKASLEYIEDIKMFCANDKYLNDKYLYFIFASRAASYRGIETRLYNYNYGEGLSCRKHYDIADFKVLCSSCVSYEAVERYVNIIRPEYSRELLRKYKEGLAAHCSSFLKGLDEADTGKGTDLLVDAFGADYIIDLMFRINDNDSKKIYRLVSKSAKLCPSGDHVRTIGTFYYRMSDGGTERVLAALIGIWNSMGYRVVLFTEDPASEDDYQIPENVTRVVIPSSKEDLFKRMSVLNKKLKETGVDTMVFHAWVKTDILAYLLVCKWNGIRFLIHTHNIFSLLMRHNSAFFAELPYIYSLADGVVVLSRTDKEYWDNFNNNVFQVVNPMKYNSVEEIPKSEPAGKNVIWCQRFSDEKRPVDAIKVFYHVSKKIPDARLWMLGRENTPGLEGKVRDKIREYNLEDKVTLFGYQKDVENYYKKAAVCMITSEYEGFPLGLMESMGAGVPVVMYELSYLTIVEKTRAIISVPFNNIIEMADRICTLLQNDEMREELGRQARKSIAEILDYDYSGVWKNIFDSLSEAKYAPKRVSSLWDALFRYYFMGIKGANNKIDNLYPEKWKIEGELEWYKNENENLKRKLSEINYGAGNSPVQYGNCADENDTENKDKRMTPVRFLRKILNAVLPSSRKNVAWSHQNLTYQLQSHTRMLDMVLAENRELSRRLNLADGKLDKIEQVNRRLDNIEEINRRLDRIIQTEQKSLSSLKKEIIDKNEEQTDEILFNINAILADHDIKIRRSRYDTKDFYNDIKCLKKAAISSEPFISVIVPVYNAVPYLTECLDSIIGQTFTDIEIVCIDDGSTDESLDILMEYAGRDKRISVFSQENRGLSVTRNRGVCFSAGKYIFFMEADDILEKDAFEKMNSVVEDNASELVIFGAEAFGKPGDNRVVKENEYLHRYYGYRRNSSGHEFLYEMSIHKDFVAPVWVQLVKKDYFIGKQLWFIDGILHEDNPYTFRACAHAKSVSIISEKLYRHRMVVGAITGYKASFKNIYGYFTGILDMYHTISEISVSDEEKTVYKDLISRLRKYATDVYNKLDESEILKYRELPPGERQLFEQMFIRDGSIRNNNVVNLMEKAVKADPRPVAMRMEKAGMIESKLISGAKVISGREEVLELLPKGGICAEIGVAYGDFSELILERMKPDHFYAVDLFRLNDIWGRDDFKTTGLDHEAYYRNRFKTLIPEKVSVCRGISWEILDKFEDDFFDYVYIDASHKYEDVSRDIEIVEKKIRDGGIIQFNDYTVWDIFNANPYGVIPAVNEFVNRTRSKVLYYCLNEYGFDDIVIKINKNR